MLSSGVDFWIEAIEQWFCLARESRRVINIQKRKSKVLMHIQKRKSYGLSGQWHSAHASSVLSGRCTCSNINEWKSLMGVGTILMVRDSRPSTSFEQICACTYVLYILLYIQI